MAEDRGKPGKTPEGECARSIIGNLIGARMSIIRLFYNYY